MPHKVSKDGVYRKAETHQKSSSGALVDIATSLLTFLRTSEMRTPPLATTLTLLISLICVPATDKAC
ncbi:hypothetical protein EJD97_022432 [Solanum chilense]|uniref:Uncharacterized protein n=1 Tax=Solanum chilense TaxID=4083 RepID=A0A6N2ADJ0_SOLCI|nr:hypothetical protein EJD97_022432 [Solanum chilense]